MLAVFVVSWSPGKGFLGTGASFAADVNLVAQLLMGLALIAGVVLAKRRRYKAHGICQTTVLVLNLLMIGLVMWPAVPATGEPKLPKLLHDPYYGLPMVHAVLGIAAEVLGLYIALVAGTNVLPTRLRFRNLKGWMRTELVLWFIVLIGGMGTYYIWYVAPFR